MYAPGGCAVIACVGDPAPLTHKRSRRGETPIDRAGAHVVARSEGRILDFVPSGWDERQFSSPGFDIPVGCLTRSLEGDFPEYHSTADDLDLISADRLEAAAQAALGIIEVLEHDRSYRNLLQKGEPQLGKRGLHRGVGGPGTEELAILWVLDQSDGSNALLDIADRFGLAFADIRRAADALLEAGLLAEAQ
jgi:aminopeptidase-like protein